MDRQTLDAYNENAAEFAREWDEQPPPADMQALLLRFFEPGSTADIGCGSGRDVAWLHSQGFEVVGYDASPGLIEEARRLHPQVRFELNSLPVLAEIQAGTFVNVICETVIMHLEALAVMPSVHRLVSILQPEGALYLSWRVTNTTKRDEHGRLYSAVDPNWVLAGLEGTEILYDKQVTSESSGKVVRRIIAKKVQP